MAASATLINPADEIKDHLPEVMPLYAAAHRQ
jgi:hypothetical protein